MISSVESVLKSAQGISSGMTVNEEILSIQGYMIDYRIILCNNDIFIHYSRHDLRLESHYKKVALVNSWVLHRMFSFCHLNCNISLR